MKLLALSVSVLLALVSDLGLNRENYPVLETPTLATEQDCVDVCRRAVDLTGRGRLTSAVDLLHQPAYYIRPQLPENQKTLLQTNLRAVTDDMTANLGPSLPDGAEYIGIRRMGQSFLNVYFWEKHQYGPIPWKFIFYKTDQNWRFMELALGADVLTDLIVSTPMETQPAGREQKK